jgi:hypothetical protein
MAKGPCGERRPDDPAAAAVAAVRIALGEIEARFDPIPEPKRRSRVTTSLHKPGIDIADKPAHNDHDSDTSPIPALGRAGGLRGGRARAEKLPKERRAEIARQAAAARWRKDDD